MRGDLLRVVRPVSLAALPLCAVLAVTAPDVVRLVYGDAWAPAAAALRWLALLAGVRILAEIAYDYLVVIGRSRALLAIQCVWAAVLVPAVWFGIERGGIAGAATALTAVGAGVGLLLYGRELHRAGVGAHRLLRA
ncbi:oligosaccharide flippase family protein, partial|uniref:oligosaccharide flippase family protein n=1 Tax=Escherichia coli TaxID=562 RepID=UPI001443B665